jgi:soluble lytic murein transglycosylase-like protein
MTTHVKPTPLRALALLGLLGVAAPARAELVFFSTGRTMSVKSHRVDGDSMIIALRSGGEATFDRSLVTRIEPDEVPYPEPEAEAAVRLKPEPADATDARIAPYGELIDRVAAAQGVDAKLVKALIQVESAYKPRATSRKGAMGLMQLMPETARQYAVSDPYDVRANIEAGIKHLKSLLDRFPKPLALAAYNAGEAAVLRFGGVPPYAETTSYVSRILKIAGR